VLEGPLHNLFQYANTNPNYVTNPSIAASTIYYITESLEGAALSITSSGFALDCGSLLSFKMVCKVETLLESVIT
jgi:hypothetical protein